MKIDATAKHIADVQVRDLVNMSNPTEVKQATVKAGGNTYSVSLSKGNIDVKFKGGFFNCFRKNSLNRMRAHLEAQFADWLKAVDPGKEAIASAIIASTDETLSSKFAVGERGNAAGTSLAVYGFSTIRNDRHEDIEKTHNAKFTMIDGYNRSIGIGEGRGNLMPDCKQLNQIVAKIKDGSLKSEPEDDGYDKAKVDAWKDFLAKNVDKVDIFGRIRELAEVDKNRKAHLGDKGWKGMVARQGLQKTMEAFVRKNLPGGDDLRIRTKTGDIYMDAQHVKAMAAALVDIATGAGKESGKAVTRAERDEAVERAVAKLKLKFDDNIKDRISMSINEVLTTAFWRQTSKLGLDFFKEQKVPVVFYWTNHAGHALADNDAALADKWWKNPSEKLTDHYGATITYSEMRHVQKMQKLEAQALFAPTDSLELLKIEGYKV